MGLSLTKHWFGLHASNSFKYVTAEVNSLKHERTRMLSENTVENKGSRQIFKGVTLSVSDFVLAVCTRSAGDKLRLRLGRNILERRDSTHSCFSHSETVIVVLKLMV